MFLITSAAYLSAEFTAEFGALPPAFLPLGNRRLYELQRAAIGNDVGPVVLSLPEEFPIPLLDQATLERMGIRVLRVPVGLSLGASVAYCIDKLQLAGQRLHILHGDTYLPHIEASQGDVVAVASTSEYYQWAECQVDEQGQTSFVEGLPTGRRPRRVLCGYFSFEEPLLLSQKIAAEGDNFIRGIAAYGKERHLQLQEVEAWYDLGHVQLYFQSKARLTTQRSFNDLTATTRYIEKSSEDARKIEAEAQWYEQQPSDLAAYAPKFLGRSQRNDGRLSYRLEYLYLLSLSELYVYGRLPVFVWMNIFAKCEEFLLLARAHKPAHAIAVSSKDYLTHAMERLERFSRQSGISVRVATTFAGRPLPSIETIVEDLTKEIDATRDNDIGIWHGDLCFSNMLYDFRADHLRLIDPRGMLFDNTLSIYGDTRYDLAKLAHSVIGRYDFIVCGRYELRLNGPLSFDLLLPREGFAGEVESEFGRMLSTQYSDNARGILAMAACLFFSMLPLHGDDRTRQLALLANGLRLYADLRK